MPYLARIARTRSTPLAVRLRRQKKLGRPIPPNSTDAKANGMTPTEVATFKRLQALGKTTVDGEDLTEAQWLDNLNQRRSRIRGIRNFKREDGTEESVVVGQKIYLPNIVFKMVPNFTPKGDAYNPYEATFRVPQSLTKTDIRSYLLAMYGVKTTYIRTDNYFSPLSRNNQTGEKGQTQSYRTYKRAVVGLVDPFYYPQLQSEMKPRELIERRSWLKKTFGIRAVRMAAKNYQLRVSRLNSPTWRWSGLLAPRRSFILKEIAHRREVREHIVEEQARLWRDKREQAKPITMAQSDRVKGRKTKREQSSKMQGRKHDGSVPTPLV